MGRMDESGNKMGIRTGKKEESKALVTVDGESVDWTTHSEDDENYAFMASNSSGSDTQVTSCSNECKESYANLKILYDAQREELSDASVEIKAYTQGLKKVEAQLVCHSHGQHWHMTGNKAYLADFQDFNGGPVAFGGSKGYITGKGKIKTGKLDFEDLPDENQILLKVPRQNNMYSFNLENIVPLGGLACLIAKATTDESNLWHRRLGHVNFKNLNRLVKGNLSEGSRGNTAMPELHNKMELLRERAGPLLRQQGPRLQCHLLPNTGWAEADYQRIKLTFIQVNKNLTNMQAQKTKLVVGILERITKKRTKTKQNGQNWIGMEKDVKDKAKSSESQSSQKAKIGFCLALTQQTQGFEDSVIKEEENGVVSSS
ncbi:ribonuclease H-like domain-containing protein [Tanacetum coccineum]